MQRAAAATTHTSYLQLLQLQRTRLHCPVNLQRFIPSLESICHALETISGYKIHEYFDFLNCWRSLFSAWEITGVFLAQNLDKPLDVVFVRSFIVFLMITKDGSYSRHSSSRHIQVTARNPLLPISHLIQHNHTQTAWARQNLKTYFRASTTWLTSSDTRVPG